MREPGKRIFYLLIVIVLIACHSKQYSSGNSSHTNANQHNLVFQGIDAPTTDIQKYTENAATHVKIDGVDHLIDFHELIRTNEKLGKETFGLIKDKQGLPLKNANGENTICRNGSGPDHTSFLKFNDSLFAVTHFECPVGGAYVMKINQNAKDGRLKVTSLK